MFQLFVKYFFFGLILCIGWPTYAQEKNLNTPIETLVENMKQNPKPMMILISTDWCKYCQLQKTQVLRNKVFVDGQDVVYYSELNAETKEDILFNGQVYQYTNSGVTRGIHELVIALADKKGQISYPLWVVLDKEYNILLRRNGLLAPNEIKRIIKILSYN